MLRSGDEEDEEIILREQGRAFGALVAHVIKQEHLPLPSESGGIKTGGVILVGRSIGCAYLMSLLGNLEYLDKELYTLLEQYVTTFMLHGE